MLYVFYFIFVLICKSVLVNGQYPRSPCPHLFEYQTDNRQTNGLLKITSSTTTINLAVKLSTAGHFGNYVGHLELLQKSWDIACAALQNDGLYFRVHFPSQNPLPHIEEIRLNGYLICAGRKALGSIITTSDLSYNLKLDCPNWIVNHHIPSFDTDWTTILPDTTRRPILPPTMKPATDPPVVRKKTITTLFGNDEDCGRITKTTPTIVHGTIAKHNYPWLTQIYYDSKFICGGNLVSNRHVITAAHCITEVQGNRDPQNFELVFGVHNFTDSLGPDTESVVASKIFTHPLYISADTSFATNDIAIIITRRVKLTPRIKPICLFRSLPDISNFSNKIGIIAGWGKTEKNALSGVLIEAKVKIISHEECKKSDYQFRDILRERSFCAGGLNGSGPCNGDSGGGLFFEFMHQNVRRYYLRGIISSSLAIETVDERICDVEKYAVYTDVAKYENWLLEFVDSLS